MARPIADTPVVKGKDAKRFKEEMIEIMRLLSSDQKEEKIKECEKKRESYDLMLSISDGVF